MSVPQRLEMVATGRLKIDSAYQRELNERRVEKMAGEWSTILAQTIDVSARNGSWYVIDGQHRLAAARRANVGHLAATVHEGLSPADEAALFVALNTRQVRPGVNDVFKARLEAQDEAALEIVKAATSSGVTVDFTKSGGKGKRPHVTRAVGALIAIHTAGGEELVRLTLASLRSAWPEDPQALGAIPLYGVGAFIATYRNHPRYDYPRIAQKLGEVSTGAFLRRVNAISEVSSPVGGGAGMANRGGSVIQKAGPRRAVLEAFNRDLRGQRIPDVTLRDFRAIALGRNPWVEAA